MFHVKHSSAAIAARMLAFTEASESVAFEGRRPVTDGTVSAIASRLVNDLEGYDRDAVETFADSLIGGWEFDKLAAAKLLTR